MFSSASLQFLQGEPDPLVEAGLQNGVDLNHEANVQHRQGNYERAAELHRQALQKKLDSIGPHDVSTAFSYNGLAEALIKLNKLDEAEQNTLKVMEIVVAAGDKFNQAYYRETLAIIHEMRGDLAKANDVRLEGKPDQVFCAYYRCPNPKPFQLSALYRCSRCKSIYYHSAECQNADWKRHKKFCH